MTTAALLDYLDARYAIALSRHEQGIWYRGRLVSFGHAYRLISYLTRRTMRG